MKKCIECNNEMKKSGPYAHVKEEGKPAYKGSHEVYYSCNDEKCKNFGKNITEIEE